MPRRCAFGCSSKGTSLHRFPDANKDPERFKTWVSLVDGTLATLSDLNHYKKKMVYDIHFTERDKNRNNRLNALAIPSLHLHESRPHLEHVPSTSECVMLEHNYSVVRRTNNGSPRIKVLCRSSINPLNQKIKFLHTEISRLRKRGQSFKTRIANAEKMLNNNYQFVTACAETNELP